MARLTVQLAAAVTVVAAGAGLVPQPQGGWAGDASDVEAEVCTPEQTTRAVRAFFAAFAEGRLASVNAMFAPEPRFQWYSTTAPGARLGAAAYRRSTLTLYFTSRIRARERLRLVRARAFRGPTADVGTINGLLMRRAANMRPTRYNFKAAVYCTAGERPMIFVWSMARANR